MSVCLGPRAPEPVCQPRPANLVFRSVAIFGGDTVTETGIVCRSPQESRDALTCQNWEKQRRPG